jgi:hypothetical protein
LPFSLGSYRWPRVVETARRTKGRRKQTAQTRTQDGGEADVTVQRARQPVRRLSIERSYDAGQAFELYRAMRKSRSTSSMPRSSLAKLRRLQFRNRRALDQKSGAPRPEPGPQALVAAGRA